MLIYVILFGIIVYIFTLSWRRTLVNILLRRQTSSSLLFWRYNSSINILVIINDKSLNVWLLRAFLRALVLWIFANLIHLGQAMQLLTIQCCVGWHFQKHGAKSCLFSSQVSNSLRSHAWRVFVQIVLSTVYSMSTLSLTLTIYCKWLYPLLINALLL